MRFRVRAILIWWWNELELDEWFDFVRYAFSHMHKRQQSREVQKNQKEVIIKTAKKKSNGHERNWRISSSAFSSFTFMLESCLGESESNRHHPAVKHNYTLLLFLVYFYFFATFLKYDELMQFSLFHLFTDRRKVVVLKSLWRDFDLREAHKKRKESVSLIKRSSPGMKWMEEVCRCN